MENPNVLNVQVQIHIRQEQYGNGGLSLNHNFQIRAIDFAEVAEILKRYDDLSKAIETEKAIPIKR